VRSRPARSARCACRCGRSRPYRRAPSGRRRHAGAHPPQEPPWRTSAADRAGVAAVGRCPTLSGFVAQRRRPGLRSACLRDTRRTMEP